MKIILRCFFILLLGTSVFVFPLSVTGQAAITLVSFSATGRTNNILIEWETATEFNNAGFFVWASDSQDGVYNPISDFIESKGDGVTGGIYGFIDIDVETGVIKYYKLEAIELNQNSEFFGPIAGVINLSTPTTSVTPTRTPSATLALSLTPTVTATQLGELQSATPTHTTTAANVIPTATRTPASTISSNQSAYPGQATATMTDTPAFNYLGTPYLPVASPTPQPAYPDQDATPTSESDSALPLDPTLSSELTEQSPRVTTQVEGGTSSPQEVARRSGNKGVPLPPFTALLIVLLIWAILAGWFYVSVRRLE